MVKSWTKELFQKLKKGAKLTCQKCIFSTYKSGRRRREAGNKWIVDIKLCIDVHRKKIYIFKKVVEKSTVLGGNEGKERGTLSKREHNNISFLDNKN